MTLLLFYSAALQKVWVRLFFLIAIVCGPSLFGQKEVRISGTITDSAGKAMSDVLVSLLKQKGESLIKSTFSEVDGHFEFNSNIRDSLVIFIMQPGYTKYKSKVFIPDSQQTSILLPGITLLAETKTLQEVTVSTKLNFIERKADRTIVNPDALISAAGNSAFDVLAKSPGIIIDQNGNIKLKGKSGVLVLIDDKPTYLSGTELENYLRTLPAANVKQFELMPNPPAHYEAAGNAGIINIRTKKNRLKGINGSVSLNYGQGRYARSNDNLMLNYTSKKYSLFSTLNYNLLNRFQDLNIYRRYKNNDESTRSTFGQNTYIKINTSAYSARLGGDYYLTDKTTIGASTKGLLNLAAVGKYNYAQVKDSSNQLSSIVIADNRDKTRFTNGTFNINLRHQLDSSGKLITCDADYVTYSTDFRQTFNNFIKTPSGAISYEDLQNGNSPLRISIYAFKSDYTQSINNNAKLDAGIKSAYTETNNKAQYQKTLAGVTSPNYALSNQFLYNEWINAAYVNFTQSRKHVDIQAGLRFESTLLKGQQLGNPLIPASTFSRDYHNLFPTLFVSWKLDSLSRHIVNLNYGRRIDRAFYKDLNPFVSPLDQYTFYSGNPYLQPSFTHNAGLSYSFKNAFTLSFNYSNTNNKIQETIEINNGIYYSRPGNIGSSEVFNLSAEAGIPFAKWLNTSVYSELVYAEYRSKLYTETLNSKGTYWYINITNAIQLKKGWSAELSGEYLSNLIDSQFAFGDYGHGTVGIQKRILKDKGSLKVSVSDVLYSMRIRGTINNLRQTDANWTSLMDSRVVAFTFSYRFGKPMGNKPRHNGSGSDSEQKRVKLS